VRNATRLVLAALIAACSQSGPPAATSAASSPTATATTAATSAAPSAPTPSPTQSVPPPRIIDVAQVFTPLASGWRPSGATLVVARAIVSGDITLVAVPIGPRGAVGAPSPIVSFAPTWWSLRSDGGALAVSVSTGQTERIAVWDAQSGAARWLTADEPGASAGGPMWSPDGASLFYVGSGADGKTAIFRIGADGAGKKQIPGSEGFAESIRGLTPDGAGLVWSRGQAGGSVEVLDMATGVNRHLENNARMQSWRAPQPRALLEVGGCCAGRPGGELVLFDDVALTSRVVAARGPSGDPAWGIATWDPGGTRVAAVRFDSASPYEGTLVVIDTESAAMREMTETRGVANVLWISEGIVFTRPLRIGVEVMLLPGGNGPAVSVYQDSGLIQRIEVVRP
jgi:hypothetical protein